MVPTRLLGRISALLLFILGAAVLLPGISVNNSLERWLPSDSRELARYGEFLDDFGSDALLILIPDAAKSGVEAADITAKLEGLRELEYVMGIGTWPARYVEHKHKPKADNPIYLIRFRPESHTNPNRPELLDRVDALMADAGLEYSLAGTGVISRAINAQTARDASRFLLIGLGILVFFLLFLLRDLLAFAQTLLVALTAIAALIYASVLGGIPMSMAHTVIPVVILFYSTSISMHVLSHGGDMRKILRPSIWVMATTLLGFSAFLFSGIPLLRDFALLGMAGITGVLAASLCIFYPCAYPFRGSIPIARSRKLAGIRRNRLVFGVLGLCLASLPGLWQLRSEIYSLSTLDPTSKAYRDHHQTEDKVGPYFPLEYVVDEGQVSRRQVSRWVREVYQMPEVGAVASYHRFPPLQDLQQIGYQAFRNPDHYRVTFFVPLLSTTQGRALARRIESVSDRFFESGKPVLNGFMTLYASISQTLLHAFRTSLLIGFLVISLMMILFLRDWKLFLPAMLVNILPVGVMLGLMGWLGIRLDMVTIPVGCLLLSIVVDDTIHYMHWYKARRDVEEALYESGPGILMTSVIITAGFAILLLSGAPPVRYFGLLAISAVLMALLSDLLVLPGLLSLQAKK